MPVVPPKPAMTIDTDMLHLQLLKRKHAPPSDTYRPIQNQPPPALAEPDRTPTQPPLELSRPDAGTPNQPAKHVLDDITLPPTTPPLRRSTRNKKAPDFYQA